MGRILCVCDEASPDLCRLCKKGKRDKPDRIFFSDRWRKDTETTESIERQLRGKDVDTVK